MQRTRSVWPSVLEESRLFFRRETTWRVRSSYSLKDEGRSKWLIPGGTKKHKQCLKIKNWKV